MLSLSKWNGKNKKPKELELVLVLSENGDISVARFVNGKYLVKNGFEAYFVKWKSASKTIKLLNEMVDEMQKVQVNEKE